MSHRQRKEWWKRCRKWLWHICLQSLRHFADSFCSELWAQQDHGKCCAELIAEKAFHEQLLNRVRWKMLWIIVTVIEKWLHIHAAVTYLTRFSFKHPNKYKRKKSFPLKKTFGRTALKGWKCMWWFKVANMQYDIKTRSMKQSELWRSRLPFYEHQQDF